MKAAMIVESVHHTPVPDAPDVGVGVGVMTAKLTEKEAKAVRDGSSLTEKLTQRSKRAIPTKINGLRYTRMGDSSALRCIHRYAAINMLLEYSMYYV
jgi:hypothetical protein